MGKILLLSPSNVSLLLFFSSQSDAWENQPRAFYLLLLRCEDVPPWCCTRCMGQCMPSHQHHVYFTCCKMKDHTTSLGLVALPIWSQELESNQNRLKAFSLLGWSLMTCLELMFGFALFLRMVQSALVLPEGRLWHAFNSNVLLSSFFFNYSLLLSICLATWLK